MNQLARFAFTISLSCTTISAYAATSHLNRRVTDARAAHAAVAAAQRRAAADNLAWIESTKIAIDKDSIPAERPRSGRSTHVNAMKNDSVCYLESWQFHVVEIVGPKDMLIGMNNPAIPHLWLTDYPTEGLVDDEPLRILGLVEVAGTRTFTTVAGANRTVRVIRLVTAEPAEEPVPAAPAEEPPSAALAEEQQYRVWTAAQGGFTTTAMFVDVRDEMVVLKRRDGEELSVAPSQLSRDDQLYYQEALRQRNSK